MYWDERYHLRHRRGMQRRLPTDSAIVTARETFESGPSPEPDHQPFSQPVQQPMLRPDSLDATPWFPKTGP
jgi:hypothetical protein